MTPDTQTKGCDQPLTDKLENLEKGDNVEVPHLDETLKVVGFKPRICYEAKVEASDGTIYHIKETRLEEDVLEIEKEAIYSEPIIVREIEVMEQEQPETFIQDREKTDSRPENGDRYVLTTIYPNGDVEDHAYSNDRDELEELMDEVDE